MKSPKYNIGDIVYHITPESDRGVVIEASYSLLNDNWVYRVAFSASGESTFYYEHELSNSKTFA